MQTSATHLARQCPIGGRLLLLQEKWASRHMIGSNEVFEEAGRFSRGGVLEYYALVADAKRRGARAHEALRGYGTTGIQTPIRVNDGKLIGTKRLHDPANRWEEIEDVSADRRFLYAFDTPSGKALLLRTGWSFPGWSDFYEAVKPRKDKNEIWVTNGRVNETWQSSFDDKRKDVLNARWPYPAIIMHPDDARPRGIESGDFVKVVNDAVYVQTGAPVGVEAKDLTFTELMKNGHIRPGRGEFTSVAIVSDEIRPGVAKAHFNNSLAKANAVCHAVPDPITGNYRYKLGRGTLIKVGESPYKKDLTQMSLKPRNII